MARPGISTKNTEKIPLGPKFWTPGIYTQNTPKIPKKYRKKYQNAHFGIFSVFLGYFVGVPEFRPGFFFCFSVFLWKFWVGPSRGSVAGRGVLNSWLGVTQKSIGIPQTEACSKRDLRGVGFISSCFSLGDKQGEASRNARTEIPWPW